MLIQKTLIILSATIRSRGKKLKRLPAINSSYELEESSYTAAIGQWRHITRWHGLLIGARCASIVARCYVGKCLHAGYSSSAQNEVCWIACDRDFFFPFAVKVKRTGLKLYDPGKLVEICQILFRLMIHVSYNLFTNIWGC